MKFGRLFLLILMLLLSCHTSVGQQVRVVNHEDILEQVIDKNVQLIDVRTEKEYNAGHIGNAVNFNFKASKNFKEQIKTLDKKEAVYLYCKSGVRSKKASEILLKEGFIKIFDYSGGYDDWKKSEH